MKKLISIFLFCILVSSSVTAANGTKCELALYQKDRTSQEDVLLYSDTLEFIEGINKTGFFVAISTDIEFTHLDSENVDFVVHVVTSRPDVNNYSKSFKSEYELPARIDNIRGKNGAEYLFTITPIKFISIDTSFCGYIHNEPGFFKIKPSAHFNYHFLKNSYGEFYWTLAKGILEENYDEMNELFNFNLPGKYEIYLTPCPLYSVIWDKRFGIMVDPTKNTAYAVFGANLNTLDIFLSGHSLILKNYGYAPSFITEGLGNFLSFAVFDMKNIVKENKNIPLKDLLNTYDYLNADPYLADRISASFIRYLVREYKIDKISLLYKASDDLNQISSMEEIYGKSVEELEQEWLNYVDTLTFLKPRLLKHTQLADALFRYDKSIEYAQALLNISESRVDSMIAFDLLKTGYFNSGDYYNALEIQKKVQLIIDNSIGRMNMGIYNLMNGNYQDALSELLTSKELDTTNTVAEFNIALCYLLMKDSTQAKEKFQKIITNNKEHSPVAESRIMLGKILIHSNDKNTQAKAMTYFSEAITILENRLSSQPSSVNLHVWLGSAYLGLGDTDNAYTYLISAATLEKRPFYLGLIYLETGKVVDMLNDHDAAKQYYNQVIAIPSTAYQQEEARMLIEKPYKQ